MFDKRSVSKKIRQSKILSLVFLINAKKIKQGKIVRAYLGIDDSVPVKLGVIRTISENNQYDKRIFLKEIINKAINPTVIKSSKIEIK